MNLNQIVNMITRRLLNKAINKGVNVGVDMVAKRGKTGQARSPEDEMSPEERQRAKQAKATVQKARKAARIARRLR